MTKLKGLLLTEGMHGMISQVEGLANALDIDFTHHKVELNSFWKLIPPKFTPVSNFTFNSIDSKDFDIIISCGRKSVIPSICLKKNSKKKIHNIKYPILIMHGKKDKIVPFYMGEKIYSLANERKSKYFTENDDHLMEFNIKLNNAISDFLKSLN